MECDRFDLDIERFHYFVVFSNGFATLDNRFTLLDSHFNQSQKPVQFHTSTVYGSDQSNGIFDDPHNCGTVAFCYLGSANLPFPFGIPSFNSPLPAILSNAFLRIAELKTKG
jgi:hypothetical protein